jgi:hypothetical protein
MLWSLVDVAVAVRSVSQTESNALSRGTTIRKVSSRRIFSNSRSSCARRDLFLWVRACNRAAA